MRVIGLMSGTSLDGIDAAVVNIDETDHRIAFELLEFAMTPYPMALRTELERLQTSPASAGLAQISSLNFALGDAFAEAAVGILQRVPDASLVGSHGQTIFHEPRPSGSSGRVASTLQLGEPAVIAEQTGLTTVADFRVTDVAAGGQGAPLVSFADFLVLRSENESRAALNIGGIANVTLLPAGCAAEEVRAFDAGPGNMLLDRAVRTLFPNGQGFDRDGKIAASGALNLPLLEWLLSDPYFAQLPPKTAGVEQFGIAFFERAYAKARALSCTREDFIATLTELSARTIVDSVPGECRLLVTSGGGVHNRTLMNAIERNLAKRESPPRIASADAFGFTVDAKEAIAFAILAYEALRGENNTLPSATGARRPVVMGKIVPGKNFALLMRSIFS